MRAETQALIDLLAPIATFYEGEAPVEAVPPYGVVVPLRDADEQSRHTGPHATERITFAIRSVGSTAEQAMWLDERVDRALRPNGMGVRLTVEGRACGRLERRASDLVPDDAASRVWQAVTAYRLTSQPA